MSNKVHTKGSCFLQKQKTRTFFLFFFSFFFKIDSQNLVLNADFEIYSTCPNALGQITYVNGWNTASLSPDYFNSCATYTAGLNAPNTANGWQQNYPSGLGGFAGAWAFNKGFHNEGRECIQTKLTDTLKQNHKYSASMFVSLCNYCDYAISSMGMYFSSNAITTPNTSLGTYINVNPQVKSKILLTDTLNWMAVRDTFTAQGKQKGVVCKTANFIETVKPDGSGLRIVTGKQEDDPKEDGNGYNLDNDRRNVV